MPVFEKNISKKMPRGKLVGTLLSPPISNFLALYTLANGITNTSVINELILKWVKLKEGRNNSKGILIEKIVKKALVAWKVRQNNQPESSLDTFLEVMQNELDKKGVSKEYVLIIIKQTKDGANN